MSLSNFCYTKADYTLALQCLNLLHFLLVYPFIFEMQEINCALFLNAKGLFFLSQILTALLSPSVALTVMSPLTTIYASL